ncbi:hypothetical protein ACFDR9_001287 [Janthinobacterium sp. CG_23.3]|uniref:CapA family protein n=1 Tax=Janthinobacterium sp. CG_23.3 TaxID=3349634 RepID=UPI0038D3A6DA
MTLMFAGDLAWPEAGAVEFDALAQLFAGAKVVANLEGAMLRAPAQDSAINNAYKFNLYSHASVADILARLNVVACGLANNHISDYVGGVDNSKAMLAECGIQAFGTEALPYCELEAFGQQYVLFGACSPLPEPGAEPHQDQACLFRPAPALALLARLRRQFPDRKLVAFMHWGYELARYPQPADREWARQAIDAGVDLVIGHHPHVVQGLERHGNGLIAYSLGNLLLPQTDYRGRKLHYKSAAVCEQLVLGLSGAGVQAHWLRYHPQQARVSYEGGGPATDDAALKQRTPFAGMGDADYRRWFAQTGQFGTDSGRRSGPVFWSYRGWRGAQASALFQLLRAKRTVRKLAIASGLHKPYNW